MRVIPFLTVLALSALAVFAKKDKDKPVKPDPDFEMPAKKCSAFVNCAKVCANDDATRAWERCKKDCFGSILTPRCHGWDGVTEENVTPDAQNTWSDPTVTGTARPSKAKPSKAMEFTV